MRPAFALVRQAALQPRALQARFLLRPALANVGCSHWTRDYSAKPKPPKEPPVEIAEETLEAEFFEEVEIEADPEWEGEEVSEGVFMSAMPVSFVCGQRKLTSDNRAAPSFRGSRRAEGEEGTSN